MRVTSTASTDSCVVFDLDGVLVESEPYWREGFRASMQYFATRSGSPTPEMDDAFLAKYEGGRVPDTVGRLVHILFPEASFEQSDIHLGADVAIDTALERMREDPKPILPSVATARQLADQGVRLAVASSSAPRFIEAALEAIGLSSRVTAIRSAYELEKAKPHPEVYINALVALGASPDNAIAIEDSVTGVEAAVAAGLRTIWLRSKKADQAPNPFSSGDDVVVVAELSVDAVYALLDRGY